MVKSGPIQKISKNDQTLNFRLPQNLRPILYDLTLKPYVGSNPNAWSSSKDFTFEGEMKMHFRCIQPTNVIVFHAIELAIDLDLLDIYSDDDPDIKVFHSIDYDKIRSFVTVTMTRECKRNVEYVLHIEYTGSILPVLYGFYTSSYKDGNQTK